MLTKEKLIEVINQLPQKFSFDDVIDRIFLLEKIETGIQQSLNGNSTPDEELDLKLPKWLI